MTTAGVRTTLRPFILYDIKDFNWNQANGCADELGSKTDKNIADSIIRHMATRSCIFFQ